MTGVGSCDDFGRPAWPKVQHNGRGRHGLLSGAMEHGRGSSVWESRASVQCTGHALRSGLCGGQDAVVFVRGTGVGPLASAPKAAGEQCSLYTGKGTCPDDRTRPARCST